MCLQISKNYSITRIFLVRNFPTKLFKPFHKVPLLETKHQYYGNAHVFKHVINVCCNFKKKKKRRKNRKNQVFHRGNRKCLPETKRCDDKFDCSDVSSDDEYDCEKSKLIQRKNIHARNRRRRKYLTKRKEKGERESERKNILREIPS